MDIARIDLNLLVAFDALFAERSVTRAAQRIGLSQPAMSGALGRLRELLGDPLFVRSSGGMLPTPRAQSLGPIVRRALREIETGLDQEAAFDPVSSTRRFTLSVNEQAMAVVLPPLAARLRSRAPGVSLKVVPLLDHRPPRELEAGEMDGAIGPIRQVPADHRQRVLFREGMVSLVRASHPGPPDRIPLADYLAASHMLISPQGKDRGSVDVLLDALGHRRHVAVLVPNLACAAAILRQSDLVLTLGARLASSLAFDPGLSIRRIPLEIPPYDISLVWHERSHRDPANEWLRGVIYETGGEESAEAPKRPRRERKKRT